MFRIYAKLLFIVLFLPLCSAADMYRCDGRIQFRPCEQAFSFKDRTERLGSITFAEVHEPKPRAEYKWKVSKKGRLHVKVVNPTYRRLNDRLGLWRGRLKGLGDVHLWLQIFRGKKLKEVRFMGNVGLTSPKKSISFHFKSSLPNEPEGWTWRIKAAVG